MIDTTVIDTALATVAVSPNYFLVGVGYFLAGCAIGLAILLFYYHLPYKRRMDLELDEAIERAEYAENNGKPKPKPKDTTHTFFNSIIEHNRTKGVTSITDYGLEKLEALTTVDEGIVFTQGILDGFSHKYECTVSGTMMTDYECAAAFRWLMCKCLERINKLLVEERVENAEEEHKKDCETYDMVKGALEEEGILEEENETNKEEKKMKKALIVVDAQNDFMPGGNLAVPEGDQIVPVINELQKNYEHIIFTQDYHPENHCSFKENGGPWPVHCVEETEGSNINKGIEIGAGGNKKVKFILKGLDTNVDSYSAFWDNDRVHETELNTYLQEKGITDVDIVGLALNVCVAFTAKDAVDAGYNTRVLLEGCKGIEINEGDINKAIEEMKEAGVTVVG